jgi:hypothetical protein
LLARNITKVCFENAISIPKSVGEFEAPFAILEGVLVVDYAMVHVRTELNVLAVETIERNCALLYILFFRQHVRR